MAKDRCPTCKQAIPSKPTPKRICHDCGKIMSRYDKWTLQERNGVMTMVHRYCDNPESYRPKKKEKNND